MTTILKVGSKIGTDGYTGTVRMAGNTKCLVIGRKNYLNSNKPFIIRVLTEHGRILTLNFSTLGKCINATPDYFISVLHSVSRAKDAFQSQKLNERYDWASFLSDKVKNKYIEECKKEELENHSYMHQCELYGEKSYTSGT